MADKEKSKIILELNGEENKKLMEFLEANNMTSCIYKPGTRKRKAKQTNVREIESGNVQDDQDPSNDPDPDPSNDPDPDPSNDPDPDNPVELQDGQCPYCFIRLCIAVSNNNAPWLGNGQAPSNENPQVRKGIYRRFWKCVNNVYGWLLPRYLEKKRRIGGGEWVMMHRREIMPECVLELVRDLYPNPNGVPYLGHMWE